MPRQDYSLPTVVALPKHASLKPKPSRVAHDTQQTQTPSPQQSDPSEDEKRKDTNNDTDSDYDMLDDDDDDDMLTLLEPLNSQIEDICIIDTTTATLTESSNTVPVTTAPVSSHFVNVLLQDAEDAQNSVMTTTNNGAPTYESTGDARLDFFFEVLKGTERETVQRLVRASWASNPLDTLRLIFQLRSILHGKGEREEFYICMEFLKKEHPKTLLYNLRFIPDHGYWKDLLNYLVFEVREDPTDFSLTTRPGRRRRYSRRDMAHTSQGSSGASTGSGTEDNKTEHEKEATGKSAAVTASDSRSKVETPKERRRQQAIDAAVERNLQHSREAREARIACEQQRIERARTMFKDNSFYRILHLEVARLFANALVLDKARWQEGRPISLAAKWCPSLNQFHDSRTLIATTIAQILFPEKLPEEDHAKYVNRVRQRLRQEYYVPLRKATPVLETLMTAQRWDEIQYNRVPSLAMRIHKGLFIAHDTERFDQFLDRVSKGESTIAAQALMPHHLVTEISQLDGKMNHPKIKAVEAQWTSYVERLAKTGSMESAMSMCDVSGSMSGEPMEVAIALSLLVTQLTRPPFNRLVLTFSESPQIHQVQKGSLKSQVEGMRCMDWGGNTDLAKAFAHILGLAIKNKFDEAVAGVQHGSAFTNYEVIKRRFEQAGYDLPQIVFWNLRGSSQGNKPTRASPAGVAMVSGFSGMLMKLFLDGADLAQAQAPVALMEKAIHSKEFSRLKVVD
ncbi:hypothetical protein EDD11_010004 [Mortierella claussenii]|nr:hypothetical protein EDD11_010004 [Mortierella claussenii]